MSWQGYTTEVQRTPIKLFYAKDRIPPMATGTAAAAAIEAAQAMQQYNASWEPKEFDEAAAEIKEDRQENPQEQSAQVAEQAAVSGFVYDANSGEAHSKSLCRALLAGYYYHEATGYYYDGNTGMYYNSASKEWLMYDPTKNEYVPYTATEQITTAGQAAIESTNAAVEAVKAAASKPVKRTVAVIGAKPQLNPDNIAANAKAEQVCSQPFIRQQKWLLVIPGRETPKGCFAETPAR